MIREDVIVIGGGLAGLTASIQLATDGVGVLVIERDPYPRHRVCGEYLSQEVVPYLTTLGIDLKIAGAVTIQQMEISTRSGESVSAELPLGGVGVSRYCLDMLLYQRAVELGVRFQFDLVQSVNRHLNHFVLQTRGGKIFQCNYIVGAFGKRSNLDKVLQRQHITKPANWVGIKAHYHHPDFPNEKVALHNFEGGYCGLSRIESGAVNVCYLANYQSFKKAKNVSQFQSTLTKNPKLKMFFAKAEPLFDQPKTIAQISFAQRESYFDGILMTGDAAGLIHPLCGNGMAMAIHSGKIAAELIAAQAHRSDHYHLEALGAMYQKKWNRTFNTRMNAGRLLQRILLSPMLSDISMKTVVKSPWIVKRLITMTHGEPVS